MPYHVIFSKVHVCSFRCTAPKTVLCARKIATYETLRNIFKKYPPRTYIHIKYKCLNLHVNAKQEKNIKLLVTGFNKTRDLRAGDIRADSSYKNQ